MKLCIESAQEFQDHREKAYTSKVEMEKRKIFTPYRKLDTRKFYCN